MVTLPRWEYDIPFLCKTNSRDEEVIGDEAYQRVVHFEIAVEEARQAGILFQQNMIYAREDDKARARDACCDFTTQIDRNPSVATDVHDEGWRLNVWQISAYIQISDRLQITDGDFGRSA